MGVGAFFGLIFICLANPLAIFYFVQAFGFSWLLLIVSMCLDARTQLFYHIITPGKVIFSYSDLEKAGSFC